MQFFPRTRALLLEALPRSRWGYGVICVFFFIVAGGNIEATWADGTVPYHEYSTPDGLPGEQIIALAQTSNGLLWIGTRNGLAVYDGHEFRSIPLPDTVRQKQVIALQPMPDGSVWAGVGHDAVRVTAHGVVQTVLLGEHLISEIAIQGENTLFVTDRAVWALSPGSRQPTRKPFRYQRLTNVMDVWDADVGPEGKLWIVNARRGPGRVEPNGTVQFADALPYSQRGEQENGEFSELQFMEDGTALVTRRSHLYRFHPKTEEFEPLTETPGVAGGIYRQDEIAYLTGRSQVLRYDTQARQMLAPIGAGTDAPNAVTTAVLKDQEGGLWVGTRNGLWHFMAPSTRHLRTVDGVSVQTGASFRKHGQVVWASTWGEGFFQLRPQRRRVTPGGRTRWVFPRSHDGAVHGLTRPPNERSREWYRWTPDGGWQFVALATEAVRGYVDSSGVGYFWHNDGLYRHVPSGDTTARTLLRSWPVDISQHHLMGPAPNGDIILFAQGRVLRLRRPEGTVVDTIASVPEHARSQGRRLQIDSAGRIWCPFRGNGLLRIDPDGGEIETLLEGAVVEKVTMAGDSLAMANTDEGLYLLDAQTGRVRRHLTQGDGLLSNDVNGSLLTRDTLYIGHLMGFTLVPTEALLASSPSPRAVLTGMEVNLEERSLTADSKWEANDRAVGFSYTGASLAHPERVHYEVQLTPQDTAWRATSRRFIRYTNLDPGTYRFRVRARLEEQLPGRVTTHSFTIPPHFYETWWFRLLVALGLVGFAVGVYRWRTFRLRRRQQELEAAVRARTKDLAKEKEKTERQARRLAELDEAKNRFFAHISHEFRTPLSLILSPLRDALQRASDESVAFGRRQIRRMTRNAERLQRLIDQLLDLATLDAGRMELDRQPGDLAVLVDRTAEAFRSKAEQKGVELSVQVPSGGVFTRFDPEKVETIMSNLVSNALKFTPEGGSVTVQVEEDTATDRVQGHEDGESVEGVARLVVNDTGPGIEPEAQAYVFDRFEQADNSLTREHEGTGLGLALTSELVELHGGTIEVESTPGEGTTFVVHLPLVPVARGEEVKRNGRGEQTVASGDSLGTGASTDGEAKAFDETESDRAAVDEADEERATVLVVEDNAEMRAYLREQLGGRWHILEAADGEEGWAAVEEKPPDLVLSDVMMPQVEGVELCRRIKEEEELRSIPVLLLTARASDDATLQGLGVGADDYIAKPFDVAELQQRIENHLAARRHLRERHRGEVRLASFGTVVEKEDVPFVEEVVKVIEERLNNPDFTVGRLAAAMALSRRQLTRRLKEAIGETPGALIRRRRIERAKGHLDQGAETIAEVAYATGFRSPSAFSQAFKAEVGVSPSIYREREGTNE